MSEGIGSDVLINVTNQLESQKEAVVTYSEMFPVNCVFRSKW
jgi:hypothetical protein